MAEEITLEAPGGGESVRCYVAVGTAVGLAIGIAVGQRQRGHS
ncbi:MAG: hypothetical protein QW086_02230 [Pyrobaculum sp.]